MDNKDLMINELIKRSQESSFKMSERDREEAIRLINEKIGSLKLEIKDKEKEKEEIQKDVDRTYAEIDSLDEDKAFCDKKIKDLSEQLVQSGVDINDVENLVVKRLKSIQDERAAIEALVNEKVGSCTKKEEEIESLGEKISSISKEIALLDNTKTLINNRMLENKEQEARKRGEDKARDIVEKNALLVLFESIIKTVKDTQMIKQMVKDAHEDEIVTQRMVESRHYIYHKKEENVLSEEGLNNVEIDNNCYGLIIDKSGKTEVKILNEKEYRDYLNSDNCKEILAEIEKEKEISPESRAISLVMTSHNNREKLLEELKKIVGEGVSNAENIGSYANSPHRKENLLKVLHADSVKSEVIGGTRLDYIFREKKELSTDLSIAQDLQPALKISDTLGKKRELSIDEIPWRELKAFNLSKKSLSEDNINKLLKGGLTNLITVKGKNHKGEEKTRSFKLMLQQDKDGNISFVKLRVLPEKSLNERKMLGDEIFSEQDKSMLKKYGQLNHLVPFTGDDGKTKMLMVGLDKETNTLFTCDPSRIVLPKFIKEQCTKEELKSLYSGNPIHVENLKDDAGQKFNGWVVLSPHKNGQVMHLKHIDNEFKYQVRNNNYGERTEDLKNDKDAKLKTKQHKSDDGVTYTSERKAYDFSEDSKGTIQHEKNYKTTKNI